MAFQDSLDQRLRGIVLTVRFLVELEVCRSCLSLNSLVNGLTSGWLGPALLGNGCETTLTLRLVFLGFFSSFHLPNGVLVIREVSTIEGPKRRNPDRELGPELLVECLVAEDGVAGILHEVQVLKSGTLLAKSLESLRLVVELVVAEGQHAQLRQVRNAVQVLHLVVVQDQLAQVAERSQHRDVANKI